MVSRSTINRRDEKEIGKEWEIYDGVEALLD